jgi:protein phosphatase 1L
MQEEDGTVKLLTANAGDSRVVISRGGEAVQLTTDHVPDDEEERERIEAQNPNPKLPLVRYVGKTWRVGGVLALSRAFGDAYMKSSLQFEGVVAGSDGYSSGFGVTAKPSVRVEVLGPEDTWVRSTGFR